MGIKRRKKTSCCGHFRVVFRGAKSMAHRRQLVKAKEEKEKIASVAYKQKVNCSKTTKHENTTREQAEAESKAQAEFRETSKN